MIADVKTEMAYLIARRRSGSSMGPSPRPSEQESPMSLHFAPPLSPESPHYTEPVQMSPIPIQLLGSSPRRSDAGLSPLRTPQTNNENLCESPVVATYVGTMQDVTAQLSQLTAKRVRSSIQKAPEIADDIANEIASMVQQVETARQAHAINPIDTILARRSSSSPSVVDSARAAEYLSSTPADAPAASLANIKIKRTRVLPKPPTANGNGTAVRPTEETGVRDLSNFLADFNQELAMLNVGSEVILPTQVASVQKQSRSRSQSQPEHLLAARPHRLGSDPSSTSPRSERSLPLDSGLAQSSSLTSIFPPSQQPTSPGSPSAFSRTSSNGRPRTREQVAEDIEKVQRELRQMELEHERKIQKLQKAAAAKRSSGDSNSNSSYSPSSSRGAVQQSSQSPSALNNERNSDDEVVLL